MSSEGSFVCEEIRKSKDGAVVYEIFVCVPRWEFKKVEGRVIGIGTFVWRLQSSGSSRDSAGSPLLDIKPFNQEVDRAMVNAATRVERALDEARRCISLMGWRININKSPKDLQGIIFGELGNG